MFRYRLILIFILGIPSVSFFPIFTRALLLISSDSILIHLPHHHQLKFKRKSPLGANWDIRCEPNFSLSLSLVDETAKKKNERRNFLRLLSDKPLLFFHKRFNQKFSKHVFESHCCSYTRINEVYSFHFVHSFCLFVRQYFFVLHLVRAHFVFYNFFLFGRTDTQ